MSLAKKVFVGAAVVTALPAAATGGVLKYMETTDKVPEVGGIRLSPLDELPDQLPLDNKEGLICDQNQQSCTSANALGALAAKNMDPVKLDQMSPYLSKFVVAIEDETFYENNGVSGRGVARAAVMNLRHNKQGGSTLASQLYGIAWPKASKEELLNEDFARQALKVNNKVHKFLGFIPRSVMKQLPAVGKKLAQDENAYNNEIFEVAQQIHEFRGAMKLKDFYSDQQIIEMYLNEVPMGRNAYGVQAASRAFFDKDAKDVSDAESLILIAMLTGPSNKDVSVPAFRNPNDPDNPVVDPVEKEKLQKLEAARIEQLTNLQKRVTLLAETLLKNKVISPEKAEEFKTMDLGGMLIPYRPISQIDVKNALPLGAEHFVQYVREQAAQILQQQAVSKLKAQADQEPNPEIARQLRAQADQIKFTTDDLRHGYIIRTTLDPHTQTAMMSALRENEKLRENGLEGAGVILDTKGQILAMVNRSATPEKAAINYAANGRNPAGSSLKGIIAALGIANGKTVDSMIQTGQPVIVSGPKKYKEVNGKVTNYNDGVFQPSHPCKNGAASCEISVGDVVALSSNEGAARIVQESGDGATPGIVKFKNTLNDLGIPVTKPFPSIILGAPVGDVYNPLQLARGYDGVANNGQAVQDFAITEILDSTGRTIYQHTPSSGKIVFEPQVAKAALEAMTGTVRTGTAKDTFDLSRGEFSVAGKTGTSNGSTQDGSAHTWFNWVTCDDAGNPITGSIWTGRDGAADSAADRAKGMTSKDTARIAGLATKYMVTANQPCDVRQ